MLLSEAKKILKKNGFICEGANTNTTSLSLPTDVLAAIADGSYEWEDDALNDLIAEFDKAVGEKVLASEEGRAKLADMGYDADEIEPGEFSEYHPEDFVDTMYDFAKQNGKITVDDAVNLFIG